MHETQKPQARGEQLLNEAIQQQTHTNAYCRELLAIQRSHETLLRGIRSNLSIIGLLILVPALAQTIAIVLIAAIMLFSAGGLGAAIRAIMR